MIKREVTMPAELVSQIAAIVQAENYVALQDAFPANQTPPIFLSEDEAQALIVLAVIEKKKAWLKYPYYDEDHPQYSEEHAAKFADVQMGIYEKTIYYVGSAFKKGQFDHLL